MKSFPIHMNLISDKREFPTLTVFTPSYNRAYTLNLCYESLLRQTSSDFEWLIIDDGSTDNTEELVSGWIKDNKIPIRYHYQKNQGMHGAYNTAYRMIDTELNVCCDSDDYLTDDAVETIIAFWRTNGNESYAGILGLDADFNGKLIGTVFPEGMKSASLTDLRVIYGVRGDKKIVHRTDIVKAYPEYPVFEDEKYGPMNYKTQLIDQDYEMLLMNQVLCLVEYRPDGSSMNMYKQYLNNPKGWNLMRKQSMIIQPTLKRRFIDAIHYVSTNIILKNPQFLKESPKKVLTLFAIPLGIGLFFLIKYKQNQSFKIR